jgi:hypothetical protein
MNINNIFPSDISSISRSQTKITSEKSSSAVPVEPQASVSPDSIWHQLASKYDVRSMTPEETSKLSLELYHAGEMSLGDHLTLTLKGAMMAKFGDTFLTKADSDGRYDMLAEFEAKIAMDKSTGNSLSLPRDSRTLQLLERLDAARRGPVHVTA